jgi:hypothetical protein
MWLQSLEYACVVLKDTASDKQDRMTPIPPLLGYMPDIRALLQFVSNEPVYHIIEDAQFASSLEEGRGFFVGIFENFRHLMAFKVLTDNMSKIMYRSELRSTLHDQKTNLHAVKDGSLKADSVPSVIKSTNEDEYKTCAGEARLMLCFNAYVLIGKTFVLDEQEDCTKYRERIVEPFKETRLSDPMQERSKYPSTTTSMKKSCPIRRLLALLSLRTIVTP